MQHISIPLNNLMAKLAQFGLDPQEWNIAGSETPVSNTLLLINKADPSFRLLGRVGREDWRQIQLLTI